MLFYTFLKCYSNKGSVNFHGRPKRSVARKRLNAPGKPYNARRDKVNQAWCHLSDQRPAHTKVPEDAGLLDSLLLPTPRGISQGTQLPLVSFNSFQRKGALEINARRRQGVQPHRPERLQGGRTASEPDRIFSHIHPPTPHFPRCTTRHRPWQPWQPLHTRPSHGQPGPAYVPRSLPTPPFSVLSTGVGDAGSLPRRNGTQISTRGRWVCRCEESRLRLSLPEKMCLERSEVTSLLSPIYFFKYLPVHHTLCLSHYFSFIFLFFLLFVTLP